MDLSPARTRLARAALAAVFAVTAAAGILTAALPASADVDDFVFDSFAADMTLSRADDGHAELAVTETLVARFPDEDQNRGIVRAIPDDYDGVPLHTQVLSVTDGAGAPVPFEVEQGRREVRVLTGDDTYVRGIQTYVISYTQRDTIRSFADTDADEFYRDVNGTEWAQPFGEVTARVSVDPEIRDALLDGAASCYVGEQGADTACDISETAAGTFEAGAAGLAAGENVTIALGFARGTFVAGEIVRTPAEQLAVDAAPALRGLSVGAVGVGLAAIATAVIARRRGRDATGRGIIVAEYAPPPGVDVLQAAHLVHRGAAGVPAAILDTAVSGTLRIVEGSEASGGLTLERSDRRPATPLHAAVATAVFGADARPGTRVTLGPDRRDVATALQALSDEAARALRDRGLTEKRRHGASVTAAVVAVAAFALSAVAVVVTAVGGEPAWWQIAAIPATVVTGIVALSLLRYRDRVTDAGVALRDHVRGLRDYLQLAEADRLRVLQSPEGAERRSADPGGSHPVDAADPVQVLHLYERLLPWAVMWGVEKEWAEALDTRVRETGLHPHWYSGPHGFTTTAFLATMTSVRSAGTPAPVATSGAGSFSGGSFGGGFSGGGSGGGGGGGR